MKKLDKWVPHELTGNLKKKQIIVLKHHLILFCATRKNYFLIRIWWVVKIGFYTTIRDDQLSGLTEKQLQSTCQNQTCTKKRVMVTVWWSDPLQLSESQWYNYIWEVCAANQWNALKTAMPAASIHQQKGPNHSLQQCLTTHRIANASKV